MSDRVHTHDKYQPHGQQYRRFSNSVPGKSNSEINTYLRRFSTLNEQDRQRPQFRQFRRLVIREALERGLISEDPGGAP